jgi:hypothetical protein
VTSALARSWRRIMSSGRSSAAARRSLRIPKSSRMIGLQETINGRFWVTAEVVRTDLTTIA